MEDKLLAIENLKKLGLATILVTTVVPGVNDNCLYDLVEFASENMPTVRGVHFQPVSYFGRVPKIPRDEDRLTLPGLMQKLAEQSKGIISLRDFRPPGCENSYCSFSANYIKLDGKLSYIGSSGKKPSKNPSKKPEDGEEGAKRAKAFVERNWALRQQRENKDKYSSFTELLEKIEQNRFSLSAMGFQDAWNFDMDRIMDCCIHTLSREGNIIPFCAYNVTNIQGEGLYR